MEARSGWLVAQTKPQRERWAAENVKRQGYTSYLPIMRNRIVKRGRLVDSIECVFPRYLFVWTEGPWRFLTGTFGVSSIVFQGQLPALLSEKEISNLKAKEDLEGMIQLDKTPVDQRFKPGDPVRINEGTFSGYIGVYQEMRPQDRVRVLLDYLGRQTPVEVSGKAVEAVNG